MAELGTTRFEGIANAVRRKRSQTSRRPKPESQVLPEGHELSTLSSAQHTADPKVSSDENAGYDEGSSKRKMFNLNQCASKGSSVTIGEGERAHKKLKNKDGGSSLLIKNRGLEAGAEQGESGLNHNHVESVVAPNRTSAVVGNAVVNESKLKKVTLKMGGVTRTIQTKATSQAMSGGGTSTKTALLSDAPQPRLKLIIQDDSDGDNSPALDKNCGLQGVAWKDFSRGGFGIGKEEVSTDRMPEKSASRKQGEKSDRARKSKRVQKKRDLDGAFDDDDDDDEIRFLEKLRTSKVSAGNKDLEEESGVKQRSLSRVLNSAMKDSGPSRSGKGGKKSRSDRVSQDIDYDEEEEVVSDGGPDGEKKQPAKDSPDSPVESKRGLTTRQRALLCGKDSSSASGATSIEFPNGLPPPAPRKQKDKLTEVEQQLKKAEAAERRRIQSEKAARELEAEAIRKILGQDSSRKKREDKLKKRQEEIAQERAANAHTIPPSTIRYVNGPTGTTVTFSEDIGLPRIFEPKPHSYPPPREKCAGPSCNNPYKYRDSKTKVPLCSLQCYKAINEKTKADESG